MSDKIEPGCLAQVINPFFQRHTGDIVTALRPINGGRNAIMASAMAKGIPPDIAAAVLDSFGDSHWVCQSEDGEEGRIPEKFLRRLPPPPLPALTRDREVTA